MRDYDFIIELALIGGITIFLAGCLVHSLIFGNENFAVLLGALTLYGVWTSVRMWRHR